MPLFNQSDSGYRSDHDEESRVAVITSAPIITFTNQTCAMRLMKHPSLSIQNSSPNMAKLDVDETFRFTLLVDYHGLARRIFDDILLDRAKPETSAALSTCSSRACFPGQLNVEAVKADIAQEARETAT
jgi:hypothetical protein